MRLLLIALTMLGAGTLHAAGNAESGKKLAVAKGCAECHGADGGTASSPDATIRTRTPILAGQYSDYLAKALADYKSGKRADPFMRGFAGGLSKQEIEDLAAWFASQRSKLHFQR